MENLFTKDINSLNVKEKNTYNSSKNNNIFELLLNTTNHNKTEIEDPVINVIREQKHIFQFNNHTYPLQSKRNLDEILAECCYIGGNYFLSCISKQLIHLIQVYPGHYFIRLSNEYSTQITNIYLCPLAPDNTDLNIVVLKLETIIEGLNIVPILDIGSIISCEQIEKDCVYFESYSERVLSKITSIDEMHIHISNNIKIIKNGSPIIVNNKIIGIAYVLNNSITVFFRLSNILHWLSQFYKLQNSKNHELSNLIPKTRVPVSEEMLYNIIINLHSRVEYLENELKRINK